MEIAKTYGPLSLKKISLLHEKNKVCIDCTEMDCELKCFGGGTLVFLLLTASAPSMITFTSHTSSLGGIAFVTVSSLIFIIFGVPVTYLQVRHTANIKWTIAVQVDISVFRLNAD